MTCNIFFMINQSYFCTYCVLVKVIVFFNFLLQLLKDNFFLKLSLVSVTKGVYCVSCSVQLCCCEFELLFRCKGMQVCSCALCSCAVCRCVVVQFVGVYCVVCGVQCVVCSVWCVVCSVYCELCTLYSVLCSVQIVVCRYVDMYLCRYVGIQ